MSVRIKAGVNDLSITHPELAMEWHPNKNLPTKIQEVGKGSKLRAWWICDKGHEWQVAVQKRAAGSKCPYCLNQRTWRGFNDLATTHPELAGQWHPSRNGNLASHEVIAGTNKKLWWQCHKGHEWEASGSDRVLGKGCPYCSGQRLLAGYNDLATTNPRIASEWHPTKNGKLGPHEINGGTHKSYWWQCESGHEWKARCVNRTTRDGGCPICSGQTLLPGFNDLATTHPDLAKEWHPTKNEGLSPKDVNAGTRKKFWWQCAKGHEWQAQCVNRKLREDGCPTCANKIVLAGFNDLPTTSPELTQQWHPTKNGDLRPELFHAGSKTKIWWRCDYGHEWEVAIQHRHGATVGCPICSNKKLLTGFNDLATTNPELAAQWHPTKNDGRSPKDVLAGTAKKIWWQDEFGHEWEATGANRLRGTGCPVCVGQKTQAGFNDLATTNPEFVQEWHPTKNGDLTPTNVTRASEKRVWWQCEFGHEWQSRISTRRSDKACPVCANRVTLVGFNDLPTTHPALAAQWHPTRNRDITPQDVSAGSDRKVWWQDDYGHEWESTISNRRSGRGCPICSGKKVQRGFNDLATTNPELLAQWHPTKNGKLELADLTPGSGKKVWWIDEFGHEWEAVAGTRALGIGCPVCANQALLAGYNDLATTHPELSAKWHPTRNGKLTPAEVIAGTAKKVWWLDSEGHEWKASIANQVAGQGCPRCAKRGYDPTTPGVFYFIENLTFQARKVGIANTDSVRLENFIGEDWRIVRTYTIQEGGLVRDLETEILRWIRKDLDLPPYLGPEEMGRYGGWSETFSSEGPSNRTIVSKIEEVIEKLGASITD